MRRLKSGVSVVLFLLAVALWVPSCCEGERKEDETAGPEGAAAQKGTDEAGSRRRLIKVKGVDACCNVTLSLMTWGVHAGADSTALIPARGGDMLFVPSKTNEHTFPYLESDGDALAVKSLEDRLILDGRTISLRLPRGNGGWLNKATEEDLLSLRFVDVTSQIDETDAAGLKRLAKLSPHVSLAFEDSEAMRELLPLFRPKWLSIGDGVSLEAEDLKLVTNCKSLEVLWLGRGTAQALAPLASLKDLRRLVLSGLESEVVFPKGLGRLESLAFMETDLEDLSSIRHLTGLRELQFMGGEIAGDMGVLSEFASLESLTFAVAVGPKDFSAVKNLPKLKRLALPADITQDEFAAAIGNVPGLEELEMLGCEGVEDLGPLRGLSKLRSLVFVVVKADLAPLRDMKGIHYLVLDKGVFEQAPEEVQQLKEALPECVVVPGEGICLGSGWILLLVPLVVLVYLWMCRSRRPVNA